MFACLSLLPVYFLSATKNSYVGEWEGLTANQAFEQRLQRQWTLEKRIPLPNFGNQTSEMFVFRKRVGEGEVNRTDTTDTASYVKSV